MILQKIFLKIAKKNSEEYNRRQKLIQEIEDSMEEKTPAILPVPQSTQECCDEIDRIYNNPNWKDNPEDFFVSYWEDNSNPHWEEDEDTNEAVIFEPNKLDEICLKNKELEDY